MEASGVMRLAQCTVVGEQASDFISDKTKTLSFARTFFLVKLILEQCD